MVKRYMNALSSLSHPPHMGYNKDLYPLLLSFLLSFSPLPPSLSLFKPGYSWPKPMVSSTARLSLLTSTS